MTDVLRRYRELRAASVLVIVVALIVGSYNVHRALGFGSHAEQASLIAEKLPSSRDISLDQFGDPVLTKADASTLKSVEKLTRIEDLQVGERIRSDAPTEEFDLQFGTDIIRADWRKVTLVAPKRDGSTADVVLLRPLPWLTEQQAEVGGTVFISVPECGIDGHADVLAIEPCPAIEPAGDLGGRVITGTFRHQVSASISLSIAGQPEPILCTGNHPFWSEDRHDFVRADSLQPNETLRTTTGTTTVTSLSHVPGSTPVYNLEIHGTHVYHVGTSGVLVHNGNDLCPDAEALFNPLLRTIPATAPKMGDILAIGAKAGGNAENVANVMRPYLKAKEALSGDWHFFEHIGTDGTRLLHGRAGEAIIIRPDGTIFTGRVPTDIAQFLRFESGAFDFQWFTNLFPFVAK